MSMKLSLWHSFVFYTALNTLNIFKVFHVYGGFYFWKLIFSFLLSSGAM